MEPLPNNRIEAIKPLRVFECSNPHCRTIWDADPHGHCPACKYLHGGWSTLAKEIKHLPQPERLVSAAMMKPPQPHPKEDDNG